MNHSDNVLKKNLGKLKKKRRNFFETKKKPKQKRKKKRLKRLLLLLSINCLKAKNILKKETNTLLKGK